MALDTRDKSILTQVAFKGAVDHTLGADLQTDEGQQRFGQTFAFFVGELFAVLQQVLGQTSQPAQAAPQGGGRSPEQAITEEFGATPVDSNGYELRVKGTQHGPLPPWLIEAAQAKGVTEVFDNRDQLAQNPKRPHFRATNADVPFWPPKGR